MIVLLSPAKSLDFTRNSENGVTQPRLLKDTEQLIKILSKKSAKSIGKLMHISDSLAQENEARYKAFSMEHAAENSKPSILAFDGGVYNGLDNGTLSKDDLVYAQSHVRILSGLYGLLRPNDLIQPYRLEMGTKLNNRRGPNLYKFWGDRITNMLNADLTESGSDLIVNLASKEYFSAINKKKVNGDILTINFKEYRGDDLKFISFNAKKARGTITRYIIDHRLTTQDDIKGFDRDGYSFSEEHSSESDWLFVR